MKLIGITANQIVSRSCPKKGKDLTFVFNGYVEWVCTDAKKGIESYDEILVLAADARRLGRS